MCNYRVTLHQRTDSPNIADIKTHVSHSGQKSFDFPSSEKIMPQVKNGTVCRICLSVERGSEDNVNTLALSPLSWCDFTTLNHCKWKLFICMTHCGKLGLLIGQFPDKHSTFNVFELKQQQKKNSAYLITESPPQPLRHPFLICKIWGEKTLLSVS